jgi:hypothetical protein
MYSGDDLSNFWGLLGFAGLFASFGYGVPSRPWRLANIALAVILTLSAFCWGLIKEAIPGAGPFLAGITSQPIVWFFVVLAVAAALFLRAWYRQLLADMDEKRNKPTPLRLQHKDVEARAVFGDRNPDCPLKDLVDWIKDNSEWGTTESPSDDAIALSILDKLALGKTYGWARRTPSSPFVQITQSAWQHAKINLEAKTVTFGDEPLTYYDLTFVAKTLGPLYPVKK